MWRLSKGELFLPKISLASLKRLYKLEASPKGRLRLLAAIHRKGGDSLDAIVRKLQLPRRTVHGWLQRFDERGLGGVKDIKQPGRPPMLTKTQLKELRKDLIKGPRRGGNVLWTTKKVADHVEKKFRVRYTARHMVRLLHKIGFSIQKPRPRHYKASVEAQEAFKKTWEGA